MDTKDQQIASLTSRLSDSQAQVGVLRGALERARQDIFDWEATAHGLRELIKIKVEVESSVMAMEKGERESEKVRAMIHKALTLTKQKGVIA